MGVPGLFRHLSHRYPCLIEQITNSQVPDFDNFYLDLNGIIHYCSHSSDFACSTVMTEEDIFINTLTYIEILFNLIKPRKVFFLAVDGVAPQAKMNQQRARRFLKIKEMEMSKKKTEAEGQKVPSEIFDSNCISPGTVFMDRLQRQIKYFCISKISTDPEWQNCDIILSGHQTPGEGEHKIMDYIRYMKSLPEYDPNTRHCIFGVDADLIMLALSTHEIYFSILRQKMESKKNSRKKKITVDEFEFFLIHLEFMRDYLDLEFQELKEKISFEYNVVNLMDDWVLMTFLLGNDFIPNLPDLQLNRSGLPVLYKTYKEVLPNLDGYLNEGGQLNLPRFQEFMSKLAEYEKEVFEETYADLAFLEGKMNSAQISETKEEERESSRGATNHELENLIKSTNDMLDFTDEEDNETFLLEFYQKKKNYYSNKLGYREVTDEVMKSQAEGYIRAIQWNLYYYYLGCQSWTWFYPHNYSPYISDIVNFKNCSFEFEMGKPVLPLEQLMAILPSGSKWCLPEPYQHLMVSPNSPIIDYYPLEFEIDLDAKQYSWEAIVLIPFVDQKRLLAALEPYKGQLTEDEKKRNRHLPFQIFKYTEKNLGVYPGTKYFPDVQKNHAVVKDVFVEDIKLDKAKLKMIHANSLSTLPLREYTKLRHFPYTASLTACKVVLFFFPAKEESILITLTKREFPPIEELAEKLLGKIVNSNWPYLTESKVVAVADSQVKFSLVKGNKIKEESMNRMAQSFWKRECESLREHYSKKKAIELGPIEILVYVERLEGRVYKLSSSGKLLTTEKVWSSTPTSWPLQTIVEDFHRDSGDSKEFKSVEKAYPVGSTVFMLGNPFFGSMGRIVDSSNFAKTSSLKVKFETVADDPICENLPKLRSTSDFKFLSCKAVATSVGISCRLLSRITGYFFIELTGGEKVENANTKVNIGLKMKLNNQNEELPGYTKKVNDFWIYSTKAKDVVLQYVEKFPRVFEFLAKNLDNPVYSREEIFPGPKGLKELTEVVKWIKNQSYQNVEFVKCGSEVVPEEVVDKIKTLMSRKEKKIEVKTLDVQPNSLYKSDLVSGISRPVKMARHSLLDRVVSIKSGCTVPTGMRGVIIGIQKGATEADNVYEILFDEPFIGGKKLDSGEFRSVKMPSNFFLNISDSMRIDQIKSTTLKNESDAGKTKFSILPSGPEQAKNRIGKTEQPGSIPPLPRKGESPGKSKDSPAGEDETFREMWLRMQSPAKPQEGTEALKKLLKIGDGGQIEDPVKTFFKSISASNSPKSTEKRAEDGSKEPRSDQDGSQQQPSAPNDRYCKQLHFYHESRNLPQPKFLYRFSGDKVVAQIVCPSGKTYSGLPSEDKESASESAALQFLGAVSKGPLKRDGRIAKNHGRSSKASVQDGGVELQQGSEQKNKSQPVSTNDFNKPHKHDQHRHNQNRHNQNQHNQNQPNQHQTHQPHNRLNSKNNSNKIPHSLPYPPQKWRNPRPPNPSRHQHHHQVADGEQKKSGEEVRNKVEDGGKANVSSSKLSESALEFVPLQVIIRKKSSGPNVTTQVTSSSAVNQLTRTPEKPELVGNIVPQTIGSNALTEKPKKRRPRHRIAANLNLDPNLY